MFSKKCERWPDEVTCRFVQAYKQLETLWNVEAEAYKDRPTRDLLWRELVREMDIEDFGVNDAKNKIRSLRSTYNLELLKIAKSKKLGAIYQPAFKWFYILKEVMDKVGGATKKSRLSVLKSSEDNYNVDPTLDPKGQYSEESNSSTEPNKTHLILLPSPSDHRRRSSVSSSDVNLPKRPRTTFRIAERDLLTEENNDECDVFAKYVGLQLKRLSDEERIKAETSIQKILSEALLRDIQKGACSMPIKYELGEDD